MKRNNPLIFIFSFFVSLSVYFLLHGLVSFYFAIILSILSSFILLTYLSKSYYFYIGLAGVFLLVLARVIPLTASLQVISVSLLIQSLLLRDLSIKTKNLRVNTEIRRDFVQLIIGIIFLSILYYTSNKTLLLFLVLAGVLSAHVILIYGKKLHNIVFFLEREGVIFGSGAIFMAVGSLILLSFVHNFDFLFFGLFALLISDPLATIFGLNFNKKIGRKSIAGSAAFFISALIPGAYFFGVFGIIFSFILMLAERFSPIDDNIFIPIIALVISFLVFA